MPVPKTAAESMGLDDSPAAGAAVATGYLKDLIAAGHLSKDLSYLTLDPNKLCRARKSLMTRAQGDNLEHVSVTQEPGGSYLGHFTPFWEY